MSPSSADDGLRTRRRHSSHDPADAPHITEDDDRSRRKSRASLSNKRVSFGGTNINIFYKDREYSNDTAPAAPSSKSYRSPNRPSSKPPLLPPRPHAFNTHPPMQSVPESQNTFESFDDSDDAPSTPVIRRETCDIPSVTVTPSPDDLQNTDVINSVNIFREEDLIMNGGLRRLSNIAGDAADTTLEMPEWFSLTRRDSQADPTDEGDVTQQISCMETYIKADDPELSNLKPITADDSQHKTRGVPTSSAVLATAVEHSLRGSFESEAAPISSDDTSEGSSVDDFPSLAEVAQGSSLETSNDRQSRQAPRELHTPKNHSRRSSVAPIQKNSGRVSHRSPVKNLNVSGEPETKSFKSFRDFDDFDDGEDDDVDMEDSCINLSMTGDMMSGLIETRGSDGLKADDISRSNSSRRSTFGIPVDQLIADDNGDDNGDDNDIGGSNKFIDRGPEQGGSKIGLQNEDDTAKILIPDVPPSSAHQIHQRPSDEDWNKVRTSRISDMHGSAASEKSPTQRVLLDDVPDGEDATIHLHPIGETADGVHNDARGDARDEAGDPSDDDITLQEISPDLANATSIFVPSTPNSVKIAEDAHLALITEPESGGRPEPNAELNKSPGNNVSAAQSGLHGKSPAPVPDMPNTDQKHGDRAEKEEHIPDINFSEKSNRERVPSEGEYSEISLRAMTPRSRHSTSDVYKDFPDISELICADTGVEPTMVNNFDSKTTRSLGTPILGKRKQTPIVMGASAPTTKRLMNKENEASEAQIVSTARPPLPTPMRRGGAVELSSNMNRDAAGNVFRESTPRSTPLSSSAIKRDVIMSSATRVLAVRSNNEGAEKEHSDRRSFTIEKFKHGLHVCNIEFNGGGVSARRSSLMPSPMCSAETNRFERSSREGRVLGGVRASEVVSLLQAQIRRLREELEYEREEVSELNKRIVLEKPKVFQKLCDINIEDREFSKYSLHLKRLKKLCLIRARLSWVKDRMTWEKHLTNRLTNVEVELIKDIKILRQSCKSIEQVCADDDEAKDVMGKKVGKKDFLRARVIQEISQMRNAKGNINSLTEDGGELRTLLENVNRDYEDMLDDVKNLSRYAETYTEMKILKFLIAGKELNEIASGLCGIVPVRVVPKLVKVMVGGHIQVSFSLHDEKVINISCKPTQCSIRGNYFAKYMEGVTNVADEISGLRSVKYACHIGQALKCMSMYVVKARAMYDDVETLLQRKLGHIDSAGAVDADRYGVEIRAAIECFCVRRPSKFNVYAAGRTTILGDGTVSQSVELVKVTRVCGTKPSEKRITEALMRGSTQIPGIVSLAGAFEGVRRMLDERLLSR